MQSRALQWILRVGVAFEFIGHGFYALTGRGDWVRYFTVVGLSHETGARLLPWVGGLDLVLAALVLLRPLRPLVAWMALWGLWTAVLRVLAGESALEFFERGANWAAPLALVWVLTAQARAKQTP